MVPGENLSSYTSLFQSSPAPTIPRRLPEIDQNQTRKLLSDQILLLPLNALTVVLFNSVVRILTS